MWMIQHFFHWEDIKQISIYYQKYQAESPVESPAYHGVLTPQFKKLCLQCNDQIRHMASHNPVSKCLMFFSEYAIQLLASRVGGQNWF